MKINHITEILGLDGLTEIVFGSCGSYQIGLHKTLSQNHQDIKKISISITNIFINAGELIWTLCD